VKIRAIYLEVLIILVLAAGVDGVEAGQTAADVLTQAALLGFLVAIAGIGTRLYQEHRIALYSLGSRRRAILYVAAGVLTLTFTATNRATHSSGIWVVVWLALIGIAAYTIYLVYRSTKEY
jgi:hypothetical protein